MRAALSRFCSLLAAPVLCWACHATQPQVPVGVSSARAEHEPSPRAPATRLAWSEFEAARAWPEAAPPVRALAHRRDGTLVHVRVEPSALSAYRALAEESPMPEGARVVAWHLSTEGEVLGGYLLEKAAGRWRGREVDAAGAVVSADDATCIRCHDMAPTDHLFGVGARGPSDSPLRESTASPPR